MAKTLRMASMALFAALALAVCGCAGGGVQGAVSAPAPSASAGASPAVSDSGEVADGAYSIAVTLRGGSGKASVESPAALDVSNGSMVATIVWSSSSYDQMVVDGVQYLPVNASGNSTFEIPVAALDEELPVKAETTAMSEPHMIDYTLRFDSSTLE